MKTSKDLEGQKPMYFRFHTLKSVLLTMYLALYLTAHNHTIAADVSFTKASHLIGTKNCTGGLLNWIELYLGFHLNVALRAMHISQTNCEALNTQKEEL